MRIITNDGSYTVILRNSPEIGMRKAIYSFMLLCIKETGDIVFQYGATSHSGFTYTVAEGFTMLIKIGITSNKEIGVGNIGIKLTFNAWNDVVLIAFKILRRQAVPTKLKAFRNRLVKLIVMCAEYEILNMIFCLQIHQFLHMVRKKLRF